MNSLFKPYLPVDDEGFVTIDNTNDILEKEISNGALRRCLKKYEERPTTSTAQPTDEVIVLTDDEPELDDDDDYSGGSSARSSHHDELSTDSDWCSFASTFRTQSSNSQNVIETVSIDSPPSTRKSLSIDSDEDWKMNDDAQDNISAHNNDNDDDDDADNDADNEDTNEISSTADNDKAAPRVNGDANPNLSALDDSLFKRLVQDINSTHLSLPSNGSISSVDTEIKQNGNRSHTETDQETDECLKNQINVFENENDDKSSNNSNDEVPVEHCDELNRLNKANVIDYDRESISHPIINNGKINDTNKMNFDELHQQSSDKKLTNHVDAIVETIENCDTEVSTILKGHEETLKNIEEILTDDLSSLSSEIKSNAEQQFQPVEQPAPPPKPILVDTACSPLIFPPDEVEEFVEPIEVPEPDAESVEIEVSSAVETVHESNVIAIGPPTDEPKEISEPVPVAESTASVSTETSLLTKSQQDILLEDGAGEIELFSDMWCNGPANDEKSEEDSLSQASSDSPLTFLSIGIDPNFRLKTYSRKNRKTFAETKTISTQTIATQTGSPDSSTCTSPVTTLDDLKKTDREIVIQNEIIATVDVSVDDDNDVDDEQFLNEIFDTSDLSLRLRNSPQINSPITYLSSTPKPLKTYAMRRIQPRIPLPTAVKKENNKNQSVDANLPEIIIPEKPIEIFKKPEILKEKTVSSATVNTAVVNTEVVTEVENPPVVVKRKRGRPRKKPLPTENPTNANMPPPPPPSDQPPKEKKKPGRKPKPKPKPEIQSQPQPQPPEDSIVQRLRKRRTKRMSIFQEVFKAQAHGTPREQLNRASRISRCLYRRLSFADRTKLATILRRINYNKSDNDANRSTTTAAAANQSCDSTLSGSRILYSFAYLLNGQNRNQSSSSINTTTTITAPTVETASTSITTTTPAIESAPIVTTVSEATVEISSTDVTMEKTSAEELPTTSAAETAIVTSQIENENNETAITSTTPIQENEQLTETQEQLPNILPEPPKQQIESTPQPPPPPTILARKTYFKPKEAKSLSISPTKSRYLSSFAPTNNRSLPLSKPARVRHFNRAQRYSRIDLITCKRRLNRKKSIKNARVLVKRISINTLKNLNLSEIPKNVMHNRMINVSGIDKNDVQNSTPIEIDLTNDDEFQLSSFGASLDSTQEVSDYGKIFAKKRHFLSDGTDTDFTYEFTTDPDSNVDDTDDTTRKSKRSRKRPKILDL